MAAQNANQYPNKSPDSVRNRGFCICNRQALLSWGEGSAPQGSREVNASGLSERAYLPIFFASVISSSFIFTYSPLGGVAASAAFFDASAALVAPA